MIRIQAVLPLLAALACATAPAQQLAAPPYLLRLDPDAITVAWITTERVEDRLLVTDGVTRYESAASGATRFHRATVGGLRPGAVYRYATGAGIGDTVTTPDRGRRFRFAVLGHTGGSRGNREPTAAERVAAVAGHDPDFVVHGGDIVRFATVDSFRRDFLTPFRPLITTRPVLVAAGNHEAAWPYLKGLDFSLFRRLLPYAFASESEPYYRIDYENAALFFLSTFSLDGLDGPQIAWLDRSLKESRADFNVVVHAGHNFRKASGFTNETFLPALLERLAGRRVDLVLGGDGPGASFSEIHGVPCYFTGGGSVFRVAAVDGLELEVRSFRLGGRMTSIERYYSRRPRRIVADLLESKLTRDGWSEDGAVARARPVATFSGIGVSSQRFEALKLRVHVTGKSDAKSKSKAPRTVLIRVEWRPRLLPGERDVAPVYLRAGRVIVPAGDDREALIALPPVVPYLDRPYELTDLRLTFFVSPRDAQRVTIEQLALVAAE